MNFGDRKDCHFASLRGGYHINPHLQKSFNKYGEDNFVYCINVITMKIVIWSMN